MKVYCDANVFIDYFRERKDSLRPLSSLSFDFFSRGWNCAYDLVVSDWLVDELKKYLSSDEFEELFDYFDEEGKLEWVYLDNEIRKKAELYEHSADARHALMAIESGCEKLVTRNVKDFSDFSGKIGISYPESV